MHVTLVFLFPFRVTTERSGRNGRCVQFLPYRSLPFRVSVSERGGRNEVNDG